VGCARGRQRTVRGPSASHRQPDAGAAPQTRSRARREVSPEDRAKIEAALPAKALARPKKPRKLLVFDRQGIYNGKQYGGHGSIPHANLAAQLMGEKTGAFTATLSSEPGAISEANLQQYDAVYLNNTVGDVFDTPEMRAAFAAFVARGGGVVGNHGASVASPQWSRVWRNPRRDRRFASRTDREGDDQHRGSHDTLSCSPSTASRSSTSMSSTVSGRRTRATRYGCSSASIPSSPT
jgi:hypothetical protein